MIRALDLIFLALVCAPPAIMLLFGLGGASVDRLR